MRVVALDGLRVSRVWVSRTDRKDPVEAGEEKDATRR
jgi:hypothetical protein